MPTASRPAVFASLTALILIWGTTWAAIRIGLTGLPPLTGLAIRFGISAVVLLLLVPFFHVRLGQTRRERWLWLSNALLSFCICYGILYWAEQYVPSGLAAVLFATFPLWVAILAHFTLPAERLTARSGLGVATGFIGVAVIFSEDLGALGGPRVAFAAGCVLLAPIAAAAASVTVKRWGKDVHPLSISAVPMGIAAVLLGLLARAVEAGRPIHLDGPSVGALLYLAIFGSAVSFTLFYWLLARLPATSLSLFNYVTPVVAVLTGRLFLAEPITLRIVLGATLVLAGVAVAVQAGRRRQRIVDLPATAEPG